VAVGFDAQIHFVPPNGVTSFSTNLLTIGPGSNRALVVTQIGDIAGITGLTIRWNGVPLTLVSSTTVTDSTNFAYMNIFALINPDVGNFALTGNWATNNSSMDIGAISYTGVDQTSVAVAFPHGNTASGNSATASVTITSAAGNAVVAAFASANGGPFTSTSGTNIYTNGTITPWTAASRDVGAATVTMTGALTSSNTWICHGCDVVAAAAAGVPDTPPPAMFKRQMRSAKGPSHRVSGWWLATSLPIEPPPTGTLAATEALDTALFAGDAVISAALAVTEALDTALFAGGPVISAALATTEAPDVAVFNGSVVVSGTLVTTEATDIAAFAGGGTAAITGTLAVTEAKDVAAFVGGIFATATLAVIEAKDVVAFAGSVGVSGTLAVTDVRDVATFAGSVLVSGTLAVTEAKDIAAFAGNVNLITGILAANEAGVGITNASFPANSAIGIVVGDLFVTGIDTAAFTGFAGVFGGLAVTEAKDVAAFTGTLPAVITGTLAANEAGVSSTNYTFLANSAVNTIIGTLSVVGIDTALFNGAVGVNGTLGATETKDTALFNGQVIPIGITGTLTVTEARDVAAFNAVLAGASGTLVATEARDIAAFIATSVIKGQLAATEAPPDTAAFNGKVGVSGTLDAVESIDSILFNGYIGSAGLLVATEARDVAAFTGSVVISATLVATEAQDIAAFEGFRIPLPEWFATLDVTEAPDTAQFNVLAELFGILSVTEARDIANFDARTIEEEAPADFENWKFGKRFDRSLTSRFPWQG
jgi:hypothetical protein